MNGTIEVRIKKPANYISFALKVIGAIIVINAFAWVFIKAAFGG